MTNQPGDISRRELLARGFALGGVAMVGSSTNLQKTSSLQRIHYIFTHKFS